MSRDDVKGWLAAYGPYIGSLIFAGAAYGALGTRLSAAEVTVQKHDDALNGRDGLLGEVRVIRAILDERLPKKGP